MSEIKIDESTHRKVPNAWQRLKHAVMAVFMGAIFIQVVLFAIWPISIILLFNNVLFYVVLAFFGILGWIFGEKVAWHLSYKSSNWWDLWNYWKF